MSNKRNGHKRFSMSDKQVPVISICNQPRIYEFLSKDIKGQNTALNGIAAIISRLIQPHTDRKVYKWTLGGPPGTGKKSTVQRVRYLLGMDIGSLYVDQFISLNGASVSDNNAKAGGKEGILLMKRLKKATQTVKSVETGKKELLPYVCLFIEDIDKASSKFMDCLGPLFESGSYAMTTNDSFSMPKKTPLIVIFTTNSASIEIAAMKRGDDTRAQEMIRQTLRERWPNSDLAKRIEPIFPFYIVNIEILKPILMKKFDEYVQESDINNRFGKAALRCDDEVKQILVDHVLVKVNTAHGIQGSISQLICKLDIFFSSGLGVIENMLAESGSNQQQLLSPIIVTAHSIDTRRFCQNLDQQFENVVKDLRQQSVGFEKSLSIERVIDSILKNPENDQIMEECNSKQEGTVNAVAMAYGDISLCSLVMNITYNSYQVVNHIDQQEEVQYLKKKLRRYKTDLKEMIHTIDNSCKESSFNSTMKQIADSKRQLIESSVSSSGDDDDDEDDENSNYHRLGSRSPSFYQQQKKNERCKKRPHSIINTPTITKPIYSSPRHDRMISAKVVTTTEDVVHIDKRIRLMESDMLLDYSDEVELYINGEVDEEEEDDDEDDDLIRDILTGDNEEEEEEKYHSSTTTIKQNDYEEDEEEDNDEIMACTRCRNKKGIDAFKRKRKDRKHGEQRITISSICNTCRK